MSKAVFFDRDDTLIIDKVYLNDPKQVEYMPHAFEALKKLVANNFKLFMVSNQSGISRGLVSLDNLNLIHKKMSEDFSKHNILFTGIYYCPHLPESNHPDRKPNPGMLIKAQKEHGIDLKKSWMVGDRQTDIEAGVRAGCKTILLVTQFSRHSDPGPEPDYKATNLNEVADHILATN